MVQPATERHVALVVVIAFVIAGTAWILFTDLLLYSIILDERVVARLETAKGWGFVALAAVLLYAVALRSAAKLARAYRTLSAVVESIGDGVLLLGSDRRIAYANPASLEMLGATLDDLRGMGGAEFSRRFHVSSPDGWLVPPDQFVSQRVFDEPGPIRYKAVLYPSRGRELIVSCTAAGVRSEMERPPDIVVSVLHDITATEQLERLRDELFTAAAHAIKTPVAVVKGAAQVLASGVPSQARRATEMIERQCARIDGLVENLLVLSRIRSGTLRLHPIELELAPVVHDVVRDIDVLSDDHQIEARLEAHPRMRADRERLVMIVRNAIYAATRSSRDGEPVTVRLGRCGDDAEIDVCYRVHQSDGGPGEGQVAEFDDIGVGRYVTTMIVEAHGGTLSEKTDGDRATIRIRLPALSGSGV